MRPRRYRVWRGKWNPLGKPSREFAVVHIPIDEMKYGDHGIYVLDLGIPEGEEGPAKIEADLVGGVVLKRIESPYPGVERDARGLVRPPGAFVTTFAAAVPGYGPLVYEAAASLVGEDIYPSSSRSSHAQRLWGRFPGVIAPLQPWEFEEKYGVSLPDMVDQGKHLGITPKDWHDMYEWVGEVASQAFDASEEGLDPMHYEPLPYSRSGKYQRAMARQNSQKKPVSGRTALKRAARKQKSAVLIELEIADLRKQLEMETEHWTKERVERMARRHPRKNPRKILTSLLKEHQEGSPRRRLWDYGDPSRRGLETFHIHVVAPNGEEWVQYVEAEDATDAKWRVSNWYAGGGFIVGNARSRRALSDEEKEGLERIPKGKGGIFVRPEDRENPRKKKKQRPAKRRSVVHEVHILKTPKAGAHTPKKGKKGYQRREKHPKRIEYNPSQGGPMTYEELQAMAKRELRGHQRGTADEEDAVMALIMAVFEAEGADLARIDRDAALKIMRKERRKQVRLQKKHRRARPAHPDELELLDPSPPPDIGAGEWASRAVKVHETADWTHYRQPDWRSRKNPTEAECDERVRRALSRKKKKVRPPVWETPLDFPALLNPSGRDVYDPREEQIRAQVQAIYESLVRRELGLPYGTHFRDSKGMRLDAKHGVVGPSTWGMQRTLEIRREGDNLPKRGEDGQAFKARMAKKKQAALRKAKQRYRDVDHLIRNRQDYEETLALQRRSGFYRPTQEPTKDGLRYFVWPMPPGVELPMWMVDKAAAKEYARELSDRHDPRRTGKWWKPPRQVYTRGELDYWLPPASVFKV